MSIGIPSLASDHCRVVVSEIGRASSLVGFLHFFASTVASTVCADFTHWFDQVVCDTTLPGMDVLVSNEG